MATPKYRTYEWKRLGTFVAIGAGIFVVALVGAAFVPFSWPDAIRRSAHPSIFAPLGLLLTTSMLAADAVGVETATAFDPSPVSRRSFSWLIGGMMLACLVALFFVVAFGLRWAPNARWRGVDGALMIWAIVLTAATEEIAFRGYVLWRLTRLLGFWQAQAIIAALFAISHFTLGGYALLPALIGPVAGSMLFGAVFARTRGIAAPIALHSGWNIAQHLLTSPLSATATPVLPIYPRPPVGTTLVAMVVSVGIVLLVATLAIVRTTKGEIFRRA